MMKVPLKLNILLLFSLAFFFACKNSSEQDFPVRELDAKNDSPLIFYISGDAGFNTFSKSLSDEIFARNYDITALNSKAYFWKLKTPEQTAKRIADYLNQKLKGRKNQKIVILGYSFGADVTSFIVNRLPQNLQNKIESVILLDPSKTADFEVSLQGMLFDGARGDYEVLPEINKMKVPKTFAVLSNIGIRFPYKLIKLDHFSMIHLPGNHRYNNEYSKLADLISQNISLK
ncbi:AcvB/VirJ family lysyl-phosphatidylglycerol hydrolase [Halpernia frigidisoli]|uniref:Virulence protein (VirJ) n=1 Tax=Halpernia frigidisoli TaxID=1125876 RepID=A0A1I3HXB6_9FLAO|nr:AcvB/VirJ family lysyl-phosphatidylglycerol hydrolase [Halpernia frigidisoli]SFI40282.1 virulence protein (VirJ) [Halpernia frigidisoli]